MSETENIRTHQVITRDKHQIGKTYEYKNESVIIFMDSYGKWHKYEFLIEKPKKNWLLRLFEKMTRYKR